jgi:hypothetical protein
MSRLLALAIGLALALGLTACGGSEADASHYAREFADIVASRGVEITNAEAECVLAVADDYVSIPDYMRAYRDGGSTDIPEDDETAFGIRIFTECPNVADKIMASDTPPDEQIGPADADEYTPPTQAELDAATIDELYQLYGEAPVGSDAEAQINAELTERGEFG